MVKSRCGLLVDAMSVISGLEDSSVSPFPFDIITMHVHACVGVDA